ncbi:hypothetical protein Ancab_023637 [Ancistrocladus abbreviatus]
MNSNEPSGDSHFRQTSAYLLYAPDGVESYDINLKEQKVTVKGNVQPEAVLQTVSKTGKKTSFWEDAAPALVEADSKTAKQNPSQQKLNPSQQKQLLLPKL